MLAGPLTLVGPLHQLTEVLSAEAIVPEPVRDVMRPVSQGLEVAEKLGPPLLQLADTGWDSLSALGATESISEIGRTVTALVDSAAEIARVTAVAADIVVRGTLEVVALAEQFIARAAALGPALFTPPGQIALLGLAAEHLTRGLQIVDRVRGELAAPTADLRRISASIPPAPPEPGRAASGSAGGSAGGAVDARPALYSHPGGGGGTGGSGGGSGAPGGGGHGGGADIAADGAAGPDASHPTGSASAGIIGHGVEVELPDGSVSTAPNEQAAEAVRRALSQQGVPYSWGGTTPGVGLDCSGLTQWAYGEAGVDIPRLAQEQGVGTSVAQGDLMPGDLAIWDGHVAMCIGNGQLVEAGDPVSVSPVRTDNIGMQFYGFYRPTAQS